MATLLGPGGLPIPVLPSQNNEYEELKQALGNLCTDNMDGNLLLGGLMAENEILRVDLESLIKCLGEAGVFQAAAYNVQVVQAMRELVARMAEQRKMLIEIRQNAIEKKRAELEAKNAKSSSEQPDAQAQEGDGSPVDTGGAEHLTELLGESTGSGTPEI